jgi:tubulin polyglutamylase TTLL9
MIKNLKRHKKALEKDGKMDEAAGYNFFPLTFHLPSEYPIFYEEFKKQSLNNDSKVLWIMKPVLDYVNSIDRTFIRQRHLLVQ